MKAIALLVLLFSINSFAHVSAVRKPNQDYREIANSRIHSRSALEKYSIGTAAYDARESKVNAADVAAWTQGDIHQAFKEIRDERFMTDYDKHSRRPTWLYPYDGCFARAEVAAQRLVQKGFAAPSKIFIFGNLEVESKNASDIVTWWYHVAVAYNYQGKVYIFDPAMNPNDITPLEKWSQMMGAAEKEYSVCANTTHDPDSSCNGSMSPMSFEDAKYEQAGFFESERTNILDLGRNPDEELGENPPWLMSGLSFL